MLHFQWTCILALSLLLWPVAAAAGAERWIFAITATKSSTVRLADMTRLSQTMAHVRNLLWIVVEDNIAGDPEIKNLLERKHRRLGLQYVYLACPRDKSEATKGNTQRNCGMQWLLDRVWPRNEKSLADLDQQFNHEVNFTTTTKRPSWHRCSTKYHVVGEKDPEGWELPTAERQQSPTFTRTGIIYFADDDNTYDTELLEELRDYGQYMSVFPVGSMVNTGVSTPIVNLAAKRLLGFYDTWLGGRQWPLDMAGFGLDLEYMYEREPRRAFWFVPCPWQISQAENTILLLFGIPAENKFTVLSEDATAVRAWHTKTVKVTKAGWVPKSLRNVHLNFDGLSFYRSMLDVDNESPDVRKYIAWL